MRGTKADPVEGERLLYLLLTSGSNDLVGSIGPKAVLVILTTLKEYEVWLNVPTEEALKLQRPLPDKMLPIVAERDKSQARRSQESREKSMKAELYVSALFASIRGDRFAGSQSGSWRKVRPVLRLGTHQTQEQASDRPLE